jgi:crossover junction endodeoxyribonuclease RusA
MIRILLPWPPRELSPNARLHWAQKRQVTKAWRKLAAYETLAAGVRKGDPDIPANIKAVFTFHPPDRRRRDLDNLLASCKPMIDGIADTIGRDDSTWQIELRKAEIRKGGAVRIELEAA